MPRRATARWTSTFTSNACSRTERCRNPVPGRHDLVIQWRQEPHRATSIPGDSERQALTTNAPYARSLWTSASSHQRTLVHDRASSATLACLRCRSILLSSFQRCFLPPHRPAQRADLCKERNASIEAGEEPYDFSDRDRWWPLPACGSVLGPKWTPRLSRRTRRLAVSFMPTTEQREEGAAAQSFHLFGLFIASRAIGATDSRRPAITQGST